MRLINYKLSPAGWNKEREGKSLATANTKGYRLNCRNQSNLRFKENKKQCPLSLIMKVPISNWEVKLLVLPQDWLALSKPKKKKED